MTPSATDRSKNAEDARSRIIDATIALLSRCSRDEVTTRAVAAEARVQPPAIYRLFGDKHGLLQAVAEQGFETYLLRKDGSRFSEDPIAALRNAWDTHVSFGLEHPALFAIMYGDPVVLNTSPAAAKGFAMLRDRMHDLAAAGLLRVPVQRAADMIAATGCGTVFTLLSIPDADRRDGLSVAVREAVIAAVATDVEPRRILNIGVAAIALRALLPSSVGLSAGERLLLDELLDRIAPPSA